MKLLRLALTVSALGALLLPACGGESSSSDDGGDDDSGAGGSQGGTNSKGGSSGTAPTGGSTTGGTATGGTATGGSGGTGGEPPDGVCEDITPCGGDPEGTWNVRENCAEALIPIFDQPGCEDVVAAGSATFEGTMTFADGVMTQDTTTTAIATVVITDACAQGLLGLMDITAADACPLLSALVMNDPDAPGTCAVDPGGCRCDTVTAPQVNMTTDTYVIMGNQLLLGSQTDPFDFCQDGDELHLHGTTVEAGTGASVALMLLLDRL